MIFLWSALASLRMPCRIWFDTFLGSRKSESVASRTSAKGSLTCTAYSSSSWPSVAANSVSPGAHKDLWPRHPSGAQVSQRSEHSVMSRGFCSLHWKVPNGLPICTKHLRLLQVLSDVCHVSNIARGPSINCRYLGSRNHGFMTVYYDVFCA